MVKRVEEVVCGKFSTVRRVMEENKGFEGVGNLKNKASAEDDLQLW